ncbi:MAG: pitrilysin family protein, partial [Acidobacteriota bacterium]
GELDSQGFQGRLEDLSIGLSFSAASDAFYGSLETLTENSDEAFRLLHLALTEPRFDEEPMARIRSQFEARHLRESRDPDAIAGKALRQALFEGHPYARPNRGTPESLAKIDREDLLAFARERFAKDRLIVGVVGDITPEELGPRLDEVFGELPEGQEPIEIPEAEVRAEQTLIVETLEVPQSSAVFGQPGIARDDPDYYAAHVANYVLGGGGFASRLYEEVREKRGLAYSVYSYLSPREHGPIVVGGVATRNAEMARTLDVIREEWTKLSEDGISAEELEDAVRYLTGSFVLNLSSSGRVADLLVAIQRHDLGIDFMDRRSAFYEALTLEEVNRVAGELFDPEALTVVVVGQPEGLVATDGAGEPAGEGEKSPEPAAAPEDQSQEQPATSG